MPHIPSAICALCKQEMFPERNGVTLEALTGSSEEDKQSYYKISADRWKCGTCGLMVYVGFARQEIEYFDPRYGVIPAEDYFYFRGAADKRSDEDHWKMIQELRTNADRLESFVKTREYRRNRNA